MVHAIEFFTTVLAVWSSVVAFRVSARESDPFPVGVPMFIAGILLFIGGCTLFVAACGGV